MDGSRSSSSNGTASQHGGAGGSGAGRPAASARQRGQFGGQAGGHQRCCGRRRRAGTRGDNAHARCRRTSSPCHCWQLRALHNQGGASTQVARAHPQTRWWRRCGPCSSRPAARPRRASWCPLPRGCSDPPPTAAPGGAPPPARASLREQRRLPPCPRPPWLAGLSRVTGGGVKGLLGCKSLRETTIGSDSGHDRGQVPAVGARAMPGSQSCARQCFRGLPQARGRAMLRARAAALPGRAGGANRPFDRRFAASIRRRVCSGAPGRALASPARASAAMSLLAHFGRTGANRLVRGHTQCLLDFRFAPKAPPTSLPCSPLPPCLAGPRRRPGAGTGRAVPAVCGCTHDPRAG